MIQSFRWLLVVASVRMDAVSVVPVLLRTVNPISRIFLSAEAPVLTTSNADDQLSGSGSKGSISSCRFLSSFVSPFPAACSLLSFPPPPCSVQSSADLVSLNVVLSVPWIPVGRGAVSVGPGSLPHALLVTHFLLSKTTPGCRLNKQSAILISRTHRCSLCLLHHRSSLH